MQGGHYTSDGRPVVIQGQGPRVVTVRQAGGHPGRIQRIISYAPDTQDFGNRHVRMERVPEVEYEPGTYPLHYNTDAGQQFRAHPQQSIIIGGGGGVQIGGAGGVGDGFVIHGGTGGGIQIARRGSGAFLISSDSNHGFHDSLPAPPVRRMVIASSGVPTSGYAMSQGGQIYSMPVQHGYVRSGDQAPRLYIRRGSDVGISLNQSQPAAVIWSTQTPGGRSQEFQQPAPRQVSVQPVRTMVEPDTDSDANIYPWRQARQRSLDSQISHEAQPSRPVRVVRIFSKDGSMHKEEQVIDQPLGLDLFEELVSHRLQKKLDAGKVMEDKTQMPFSEASLRKPKKTILRQQMSDETPPGSPTYDSPKRNMFKNFRIVFDSCGDEQEGQPSEGVSKAFHFKDFDDMVNRIQQVKEKVESAASEQRDCGKHSMWLVIPVSK